MLGVMCAARSMGIRLFVGGDAGKIQGRPVLLTGDRCFTAAQRLRSRLSPDGARQTRVLLDGGAFSDRPVSRLTHAAAPGTTASVGGEGVTDVGRAVVACRAAGQLRSDD